jgi:putative transposase
MDLGNRKIVGWAYEKYLRKELTIKALSSALARYHPPPGLIHHSDRGSQYACNAYRKMLTDNGFISSMSRKGNCWDNAPMESLIHTIKTELTHHEKFKTREEAFRKIFEYIELFYNNERIHSSLGYTTPNNYGIVELVA